MSMEEPQQTAPSTTDVDAPMQDSPTTAVPAAAGGRRPRLNLSALGMGGSGERKRGKSMFGVLVNTLNKAKAEDKERNASEAAKKRQLIEQRLQSKLKKETDHVRQIEEAKRDKVTASRKEEDLQLKDSIHKFRRTHLPLLSNFLLTSDVIPTADADIDSDFKLSSLLPPRSHPPPLYYFPAVLTPEQEAFLSKRRELAKEAVDKEWEQFKLDRAAGIEEVSALRKKAATIQDTESKTDRQENGNAEHTPSSTEEGAPAAAPAAKSDNATAAEKREDGDSKDTEMEVDDGEKANGSRESQGQAESEKESRPQQADEDDAVEY